MEANTTKFKFHFCAIVVPIYCPPVIPSPRTHRVKGFLVSEADVNSCDRCRASVSVNQVAAVAIDISVDRVVVNPLLLAAICSHFERVLLDRRMK